MTNPEHRATHSSSVHLTLAAVALVVALAGVTLAALALARSAEATTLARIANDRPVPAAPTAATQSAAPVTQPVPSESQETVPDDEVPGTIDPSAEFTAEYSDQRLRIRSTGCDSDVATPVDLDEPRVLAAADDTAELGYSGCSPGKIEIGTPSFAQMPEKDAKPGDCLEAIRTNPGRSPVTPTRGMTLCLVTSTSDSPKLVLFTIDSISKDDGEGVLNVTANAWRQ